MTDLHDDWNKLLEEKDAKNVLLQIFYSASQHKFKVNVSYNRETLSEQFNALYRPTFGMDIEDYTQAMEIADILAAKIDKKFNL
ncbi:MAG: hypothetical protein CO093_11135 [Alphaproteobacteria bacterium CG_4_9_14_3_um_filter_47_13]|nr:MAG: hypothetical protein CO093_11135 [Alphaproteobacteria bacterium CG_4_9_14_3_um_filter_47_13]